eukprot:m.154268 g.154268  ORF g.154268 m.154268 type:complete len:54 (+) comp16252_c1_seq5:264-425(+)
MDLLPTLKLTLIHVDHMHAPKVYFKFLKEARAATGTFLYVATALVRVQQVANL